MSKRYPIASREEVEEFLLMLRLRLAEDRWSLIDREKNLESISDLNMLLSDIPGVLRKLSVEDYAYGPLDDDRGRSMQWWVFGPQVGRNTLYVKVAIHQGRLLCMSFHRSQFPLPYPYKEATQP